ncbi:MAG: phosphatidylserine decarboxylase family protein [Ignavibacteria bacterium]
MRLTIYGRSVVLKVLFITLLLDIIALVISVFYIKLALLGLSILLFGFTLFFFRDPVRKLPEEIKDNHIISPADGKVMMIEEIGNEPVFLKSPAKLIAIFLSPLNVHVNRIPVSGVIDYYEYIKGDYIVAFDHKSSARNERTIVGITNEKFKVLFKQIAGFVARRIICNTMKGSNVKAGEKFGMIRFGSRMDVIIPEHSNILVSVNQKVTGGETILAEVPV